MGLIRDVSTARAALPAVPPRSFAWVMTGAFAVLAFGLRHRPWARDAAALCAALFALAGALFPTRLAAPWRAWMTLALTLGWLMSRAVLILLFALVLTPIGLLARLFGKRFLELQPDPKASTYWVPRAPRPAHYEKMF